MSIFWAVGMEPFLLATGQTAEVARLTSDYMRLLIPGLFGAAASFAFQKYLQVSGARGIVHNCCQSVHTAGTVPERSKHWYTAQ